MLISFDADAVRLTATEFASAWPDLTPEELAPGDAARLEPALHPDLAACRIDTAYPVAPAAATLAFARRAERAGAVLHIGGAARPVVDADRVAGVETAGGGRVECEQILVAAGPWSPSLIPGWDLRPPIRSIWGVVVSTTIAEPPRHVLEELGIGSEGAREGKLFSLVTVRGSSSVGSTFIEEKPDQAVLAPEIIQRGEQFVPALGQAAIESVRACARPAAFDGKPLIGAVPGVDGLFVCAGHGPWGISTGPASARLVADQMLGVTSELDEFSPSRWLA
jgi:glycine/D-amino acid oxidase-like deaminating enzyme